MLSWFLIILWISIIFLLIGNWSFFRVPTVPKKWMFVAFSAKILCAGLLLWLYTSHYPNRKDADIYKYYDDGKIIASVFNQHPLEFAKLISGFGNIGEETVRIVSTTNYWDRSPSLSGLNDNRLIICFNAVLSLISQDNIFMHMLLAAFMAFIGLTFLLKSFLQLTDGKALLVFTVVFFSPSLFFWTSGILKEAFMVFGLGGFFYYTNSICRDRISIGKISAAVFFIAVLILSKLYVALLIVPALLAFTWNYSHNDGKAVLRYLIVNLLFLGLLMNLSSYAGVDILGLLVQKQDEFKCLAEWMNAGSIIYVPDIDHHWTSLVGAAPYALFNTFLRPHPFDKMTLLSLIAMFEILGFALLIPISFIYRKPASHQSLNLLMFSLNFAILLGLLIGWTTPVLGAIVRYRVPILLFLLVSMIDLTDTNKIPIVNSLIKKTG